GLFHLDDVRGVAGGGLGGELVPVGGEVGGLGGDRHAVVLALVQVDHLLGDRGPLVPSPPGHPQRSAVGVGVRAGLGAGGGVRAAGGECRAEGGCAAEGEGVPRSEERRVGKECGGGGARETEERVRAGAGGA